MLFVMEHAQKLVHFGKRKKCNFLTNNDVAVSIKKSEFLPVFDDSEPCSGS
jgi:hypothetical protein